MAERRRAICVVTGSRAEYGLLHWLMKEIAGDPGLDLRLVVTGTHLSPAFGETVEVIEADGFAIDGRVDIEVGEDTPVAVARSMGLGVIGMAEAFDALAPDIVVVLGDRFEILAAAEAALLAGVPIAHIHGGEVTEGAIDDAMRHAITKMAAIHLVAAEPYRDRVIQLGENPDRVFTVGAPGLDNIEKLVLLDRAGTERALGLPGGRPYFVVTYHPATRDAAKSVLEAEAMLRALDQFTEHHVVVTGVNADPGRGRIDRLLTAFVSTNAERATFHESLGQLRYLSAVRHADAVVGNSSSGIVEAPALGVPTVNIGDRQKGRLKAASVVDCDGNTKDVAAAIGRALDPAFRSSLAGMALPYGSGGASARIKDILASVDLSHLAEKAFHDLPVARAAS